MTLDIENRRYNTAIAAMMEFTNFVAGNGGVLSKEDAKPFILLLAPFAPHLSEELWQQVNEYKDFKIAQSVHVQPWPTFDASQVVDKDVTIAIQVNGKLRDTITVPPSSASIQKDIETLAKNRENVVKYLAGKPVRKAIFVPGRLINFVL